MNPNYKNYREEQEINLVDLMWYLLHSWRLILIAMLIGLLLGGGIKYLKDQRQAAEVQNQDPAAQEAALKAEIENIEKSLTILELNQVEQMIDLTQMIETQRAYKRESLYASMDPYHVSRVVLQYKVESTDSGDQLNQSGKDSISVLLESYAAFVNFSGWTEQIKADGDIKPEYLQELVKVVHGNLYDNSTAVNVNLLDQRMETLLTINVSGDSLEKANQLADCIDKGLRSYHEELVRIIGHHKLTLISRTEGVLTDSVQATAQNNLNTAIFNSSNQLNTMRNAANADQKKLFEKLTTLSQMEKQKEAASGTVTDTDFKESEPKSLDKRGILKYALAGLLLSVFIACGYRTLRYILNGTIKEDEEIQELYGLRLFGTLKERNIPCSKTLGFIDDWMDRIRYREQLSSEETRNHLYTNLQTSCQKEQISRFVLSSSGKITEEDEEMIRPLIREMELAGIEVVLQDDLLNNSDAFRQMSEIGAVVLIEKIGRTRYEQLEKAVTQCLEQKSRIMGVILL